MNSSKGLYANSIQCQMLFEYFHQTPMDIYKNINIHGFVIRLTYNGVQHRPFTYDLGHSDI